MAAMEFIFVVVDLRRERDIEQLRRVAFAQKVQIEQLLRVLRAKCAELSALKGNETELQQTLALIAELTRAASPSPASTEAAASPDSAAPKKDREHSGPTEQPTLPHVEQVFELDAADMTCPSCGGDLRPMKGQFETSEMVDVVEVSYRVVQVKQQKYACKCGGCIETAPGPERATPGGRYSLDFAIKVAVDKYIDHIPLARQRRILRRRGLAITTQTLWDQLHVLGRRLEAASRGLLGTRLPEVRGSLPRSSRGASRSAMDRQPLRNRRPRDVTSVACNAHTEPDAGGRANATPFRLSAFGGAESEPIEQCGGCLELMELRACGCSGVI